MRLILCFLITIIAIAISSCIPCESIACDQVPPYGHFILVNETWQDLVFGPNRIYDPNQFKFYALFAPDTTFFEYRIVETGDPIYESCLRVLFFPLPEVAYMQLSDGDIDTLNISSMSSESRLDSVFTKYYISDFHCNKYKLIVELDGKIHLRLQEDDLIRTEQIVDW